jgi:hypothetical protein
MTTVTTEEISPTPVKTDVTFELVQFETRFEPAPDVACGGCCKCSNCSSCGACALNL